MRKFVPDIELTEWVVRLFVRQEHGMELVQCGEKVKGYRPKDEFGNYSYEDNPTRPSGTKTKSQVSYIKHDELEETVYDYVQTLSGQKQKVIEILSEAGVTAILADDEEIMYRMPRWIERRLQFAYKTIAARYEIGYWERQHEKSA